MQKQGPIYSIQILRGFAAAFIVIGHAQAAAKDLAALSGQTFIASQIIPWGFGVDLFFVISGFIIFYAGGKYQGSPPDRRTFIVHRIARLVPLYWSCTILFVGLVLLKKTLGFAANDPLASPLALFLSLLFLPYSEQFLPYGLAFPAYDLGWTLNYEMYFYVLFALCLGATRTQTATRTLAVLAAVVTCGVLFSPSSLPIAFWCQPIILEFGMGLVISYLYYRDVKLPTPIRAGLFVIGMALIVFVPFGVPPAHAGTVINGFERFAYFGLPAAFIVAAAALGPDIRYGKWIAPFVETGNASYSLYLTHPFVIFFFSILFRRVSFLAAVPLPAFVALVLVTAILSSMISYRYFERPSANAVVKMLTTRKREPTAQT